MTARTHRDEVGDIARRRVQSAPNVSGVTGKPSITTLDKDGAGNYRRA